MDPQRSHQVPCQWLLSSSDDMVAPFLSRARDANGDNSLFHEPLLQNKRTITPGSCSCTRRALILGIIIGSVKDLISMLALLFFQQHCGRQAGSTFIFESPQCFVLNVASKVDAMVCTLTWFTFFLLLAGGVGKLRAEGYLGCNECWRLSGQAFDIATMWLTGMILGSFNLLLIVHFLCAGVPIPFIPLAISSLLQLTVCYLIKLTNRFDDDNVFEEEDEQKCDKCQTTMYRSAEP